MVRTANTNGMTLSVPAEFCDQTCLKHTLATNVSKWLPTEAKHRDKVFEVLRAKASVQLYPRTGTVTLPAGTAAIPAALPHCFNHRPYQRQTWFLMAQHRPSGQGKGPCITSQTVLKCHPTPRLQQHTARALIPLLGAPTSWQGAPSGQKVFPQKPNQTKKALSISAIKDQEVEAEWWRAVVLHLHEAVVLDL